MKPFCVTLILVACTCGAGFLVSANAAANDDNAPAPVASPSVADAQAKFAAGDYHASLRIIARLLSSNLVKPDTPERYDLFMLRGECMLRLKQRIAAQEAFDAASRVMKQRQDVDRVACANAMAALVKASGGLEYKPALKVNDRGTIAPAAAGIDIVEPESRKRAMTALYEDKAAELAPDIANALSAKSLVPIHGMLPAAWELYSLEYAATGKAEKTETQLKELGSHARTLISGELDRLTTRLDELRTLASEPTLGGIGGGRNIGYRGLSSPERKEIEDMADYLVKIQRSCENARRIARTLGGTSEYWDALLADCAVARDVAQQAFDKRY
jgi:hypothetical protein